jgi:hypothetical protein
VNVNRGLWCVLGALVLVTTAATAQKTIVGVEFHLVRPVFRSAFLPSERIRVEAAAAAQLIAAFTNRLQFLSFSTDTVGRQYVLVVELDWRERSARADEVTGLHVGLRRPGQVDWVYWLDLRPVAAAADSVGTEEQFLAELESKVAQVQASPEHWQLLVTRLLRRVPIAASSVKVWGPPTVWLLPYKPEDLCYDKRSSRFEIDNDHIRQNDTVDLSVLAKAEVFRPSGAAGAPFRHRIQATPLETQSVHPDSLRVKAVYVSIYDYDGSECRGNVTSPFGSPVR